MNPNMKSKMGFELKGPLNPGVGRSEWDQLPNGL
jgi:hypothetical protein